MDVQGPNVVRPWVEKHGVTFPVAVDTADVFGAAFALKAIPVSFLVDEVGIIRLQGGGPSKEFREKVEEILREPLSQVRSETRESVTALPLGELRARVARDPASGSARLALAQALERTGEFDAALAECQAAATSSPNDAAIPFTHGLILLWQDRKQEALALFVKARDLDSSNWRIRKQIWALENPDKFYSDSGIDWNWQKEQKAREKTK